MELSEGTRIWLAVLPTLLGMGHATWHFYRIRHGWGVPDDWLPLACGLAAFALIFPLALLIDSGILEAQFFRTFLVLFLIPGAILGVGYSGVRSARLEKQLKKAFPRLEPHLESRLAPPALPDGPDELAALEEDIETLRELIALRFRMPEDRPIGPTELDDLAARIAARRLEA